jgi:hypothetical protein
MSKVYLGRFNQYKVGNRVANGMKEAKFFQRGYKLLGGKEYKIEKLNKIVDVIYEDGFFQVQAVK